MESRLFLYNKSYIVKKIFALRLLLGGYCYWLYVNFGFMFREGLFGFCCS